MEATDKVYSWEEKTQEFFRLLGRLDKRQVPPCPAAQAVVPLTPSQPSLFSPSSASLPLYNSILGTIFPLKFWKQETTSLSPPWRDLPRGTQLGKQAAAPTARERCHAQGEIYSSSPLQTLHLARCRADSSSFPGITNSSSSTGVCTVCLGSHTLNPPEVSIPAMGLADGRRQPKGRFPKPASLNGAVLWYLLSLYNSVICCQYIFVKKTKIRLFFLIPQPMKKSQLYAKRLVCVCMCICVCILGGENSFCKFIFQLKVCLVAREALFSPYINLGRKALLCAEQKWQYTQWELGANPLTAPCPRFSSLGMMAYK